MSKICAKAHLYGMTFTPNSTYTDTEGGQGGGLTHTQQQGGCALSLTRKFNRDMCPPLLS